MTVRLLGLDEMTAARCRDVARLMIETWPDHYGPNGSGDAALAAARRADQCDLPCGVAAFSPADEVIGTAALAQTSFGAKPEELLWCIGLCVVPAWRGCGVASAMVAALEARGESLGYTAMFTTTQAAEGLFRRLGWKVLRDVPNEAGNWRVLAKSLL